MTTNIPSPADTQARSLHHQILQHRRMIVITLAILGMLIFLGYQWSGAGFSGQTLWDWMELLVVPVVLTVFGVFLTQRQRWAEHRLVEQRTKAGQDAAEAQRRNDYGLELLRRSRDTYNSIKRVRRTLKATGFAANVKVEATGPLNTFMETAYLEQMALLDHAELSLESIQDELPYGLFQDFAGLAAMRGHLSAMEQHLKDNALDEYERVAAERAFGETSIRFEDIPKLQAFARGGGPPLSKEYHDLIRQIALAIRTISPPR